MQSASDKVLILHCWFVCVHACITNILEQSKNTKPKTNSNRQECYLHAYLGNRGSRICACDSASQVWQWFKVKVVAYTLCKVSIAIMVMKFGSGHIT